MTTAPTLDLAAVKARQQATWASGDYAEIATLIVPVAERLTDAADLRAARPCSTWRAGAATRRSPPPALGCDVTGIDYVPALLERGRERAAAERIGIDLLHGDAEEIPFADESFDAAVSVFGTMFAPDQGRTAAELVRVTRPGGTHRARKLDAGRLHRRACSGPSPRTSRRRPGSPRRFRGAPKSTSPSSSART